MYVLTLEMQQWQKPGLDVNAQDLLTPVAQVLSEKDRRGVTHISTTRALPRNVPRRCLARRAAVFLSCDTACVKSAAVFP